MWMSKDNLKELLLFFYYVDSEDLTQDIKLGRKSLLSTKPVYQSNSQVLMEKKKLLGDGCWYPRQL